jgi:hypothetical protein
MITGDEKRFVKSYLISLSEISTPEEYTIGAIPLIQRDRPRWPPKIPQSWPLQNPPPEDSKNLM